MYEEQDRKLQNMASHVPCDFIHRENIYKKLGVLFSNCVR
jgi:hypothetical protein